MSAIHRDFEPLIAGFGPEALQGPQSVCGLFPDYRIGFFNDAWERFAEENGAPELTRRWGLGENYLAAISGPQREYFRLALIACARTRRRWDHEYECSSPDVHREMALSVYPLDGGWLLVHALKSARRVHAHPAPAGGFHVDEQGIAVQCGHCRKTRRVDDPRHWEWVPELVAQCSTITSHGLCPVCLDHYYPALPSESGEHVIDTAAFAARTDDGHGRR